MKYFHCLLKITFKVTLHHPCRPAPTGGSSLVQSTDTASWGRLQAVLRPHWGADQAHKSKGQGSTNLGRQSPPPSAELSTGATRDPGEGSEPAGPAKPGSPWPLGDGKKGGHRGGHWGLSCPWNRVLPTPKNASATIDLTNRANPGTTSSPFFLSIKPAKILSVLLHSQDCHGDQV